MCSSAVPALRNSASKLSTSPTRIPHRALPSALSGELLQGQYLALIAHCNAARKDDAIFREARLFSERPRILATVPSQFCRLIWTTSRRLKLSGRRRRIARSRRRPVSGYPSSAKMRSRYRLGTTALTETPIEHHPAVYGRRAKRPSPPCSPKSTVDGRQKVRRSHLWHG